MALGSGLGLNFHLESETGFRKKKGLEKGLYLELGLDFHLESEMDTSKKLHQ